MDGEGSGSEEDEDEQEYSDEEDYEEYEELVSSGDVSPTTGPHTAADRPPSWLRRRSTRVTRPSWTAICHRASSQVAGH